jgi:2-hydroxy-6-oxonona-2,4-dienedioate hydrolase
MPASPLASHGGSLDATFWAAQGVEVPVERRLRLRRLGVVEVRIQELGEGPPVLFVPALVTTGAAFAPLVARLAGFRCFLLDRPGTGASDPLPAGWQRTSLAPLGEALVVDVLDALGLERAHLVGGSLGGSLALLAAAYHPGRVDRIVQLGCPAFVPGMKAPAFLRLLGTAAGRRVAPGLLSSPRGLLLAAVMLGHRPTVAAGRLPAGFVAWATTMLATTATVKHELEALAPRVGLRGVGPEARLDVEFLASVTAPTGFLWGTRDVLGGPDLARRTVASLPDATLELVPDGGHLPWLDAPQQAAAFTTEHLGGGGRSGG